MPAFSRPSLTPDAPVRRRFGLARGLVPGLLLLSSLALAACDSPQERADAHYERGMAFLAEGDPDRALVEFRNVFKLDGENIPARIAYAGIQRDRGQISDAFGQYLRAADQDPGNLTAQRAVIELALQGQDLQTAEEHADEALRRAPDDPDIRALKATLDFRDPATRPAAIEMARAVLVEAPDNVAANMVLIADRISAGAPGEALPMIDSALKAAPEEENLHMARLAVLEQLGETAATGEQLRQMAELFPDDQPIRQALIQWYLRQGDVDGAEAAVRAMAARAPENTAMTLAVAQFLRQTRGSEAARAELEAQAEAAETAGADAGPFLRALAGLDFAEGHQDKAIAALRDQLAGTEASDSTRDLQLGLAEMLVARADAGPGTDPEADQAFDPVAAKTEAATLLATVLEGDPSHVAALKLRARMAVAEDRPADAIQDMRTASGQAPRDPEIMTIMALAHERDGSRELAGERLALAVEASAQAPDESLRYARFLMQDQRVGPAEGVVVDALRRAPENADLLQMLGQIHIARADWSRADQVAVILRRQGTPAATAMATSLETASLRGQGRGAEVITALEGAMQSGIDARAMADLMQSYVQAGNPEAARAYLDKVLADHPEDVAASLLRAGLDEMTGDSAAAEARYRAVIATAPDTAQPYQAFYAFLGGQGRAAEAEAVLAEGVAASRDNSALLFLQAGLLEGKGDTEGAIGAYETLYARDSSSQVLANNLASLLTSARDDQASLERAYSIARRLRSSDVPHFQDTYGWILHRRGDDIQALRYIEPAAGALSDNALVQFHLAEVQLALGRRTEAGASYARALEAAEAGGAAFPQAETARARVAELAPAPAN